MPAARMARLVGRPNRRCTAHGAQGRHGLRRCARCEDGFDVEEVPVQAKRWKLVLHALCRCFPC